MWHKKIENSVEDWFYHEFQKRSDARIFPQHEVCVGDSPYRLDFLLTSNYLSIGVEVDGKDYHDVKRDSYRDTRILRKYDNIDAIVRFEAHDLYYNAPITTLFFCNYFPGIIVKIHRSSGSQWLSDTMPITIDHLLGKKINQYSNIGKAKKAAIGYLKTQGVYNYGVSASVKKHGYDMYVAEIDFMPPDKWGEYDNDIYDGLRPNPLDYTNKKFSTIKVMKNGL